MNSIELKKTLVKENLKFLIIKINMITYLYYCLLDQIIGFNLLSMKSPVLCVINWYDDRNTHNTKSKPYA